MTDSAVGKVHGIDAPNAELLMRQMKDYADIGMKLLWQRQVIFLAALSLAGFYYSLHLAILTAVLIAISEIYDFLVLREILTWDRQTGRSVRMLLIKLVTCTISASSIIVFYAVSIAMLQGPGSHFMSMFLLFAAAIFAAMNNHQILPLLILRLVVYGSAFVSIPAYDIVITSATIQSELWAQLFTSIFVLYFIIDCSRVHLSLYRKNMSQMDELWQQHQMTIDALRIKSDFLSTMSHELRTPLTSIKGSIDIIDTGHFGEVTPQIKRIINIAQRNCKILVTLINDILDLQKVESGSMTYRMEILNAAELVTQSIAANGPYAEQLGVTLSFEPSDHLLSVTGDRHRLNQVLANMLSNAAKFSPKGSDVSVRIEQVDHQVRISITDRGIGLNEADAEKVFDRFTQLDSSEIRKVGGTGLGMNISRRIMEAHGGAIGYKRNSGPGTTFFVQLS